MIEAQATLIWKEKISGGKITKETHKNYEAIVKGQKKLVETYRQDGNPRVVPNIW